MAYNIVKKNQPNLIDHQLAKKLARINNIDIKTGGLLNEPEPNQFNLLLSDIKNCVLSTLRKNWLLIITLIIITYYLYQRYQTVKEIKLQKDIIIKEKAHEHVILIKSLQEIIVNIPTLEKPNNKKYSYLINFTNLR